MRRSNTQFCRAIDTGSYHALGRNRQPAFFSPVRDDVIPELWQHSDVLVGFNNRAIYVCRPKHDIKWRMESERRHNCAA